MLKLVLATRNRDKIKEIRAALKGLDLDILTLEQFPQIPEVVENGQTIDENALKKATAVAAATDLIALADDTGLEVDFLGGRPGIYSSRFAGEGATYDDNVNKLLCLMKDVPREYRKAQFRCAIAICGPNIEKVVHGVCEGFILHEKRGTYGFGYDPVFYVPEYDQTFAEMSLTLKNRSSHRGLALKQARKIIHQMIKTKRSEATNVRR